MNGHGLGWAVCKFVVSHLQIRCWKLCARLTPSRPCRQSRRRSTTSRTRYRRRRRWLYRSTRSTRTQPPRRRRCPSLRLLLLLRSQRPRHPLQPRSQPFLLWPCRRKPRRRTMKTTTTSRPHRYVAPDWMHVSCPVMALTSVLCLCLYLCLLAFVCVRSSVLGTQLRVHTTTDTPM